MSDLDQLLEKHALAAGVPGAAIGVLQDGEERFAWYGVDDVRTNRPVTAESRFGVGSLTKSMVATVVARLAHDAELSLEDPVDAHVPELRPAAWAGRATIRDLLANRSGLPLQSRFEFAFDDYERDDDDRLSGFAATLARAEPTPIDWSYTNAGWCLLGRVIETVTGSTWEDAMRARLLAPAGMRGAAVTPDRSLAHRVSGHRPTANGPVAVAPLVARTFGPAGTSMVSTCGDLLQFAALHLTDPALAVLRDRQGAPRIHGWFDDWCLGLAWFDWDGGPAWGWDSVLPGERAVLRLFPDRQTAVVMLANSDNGRAMYRSLFAELMPSLCGVDVPPLSLTPDAGAAADLSRFAGSYAWADRRVEVTSAGTILELAEEKNTAEARWVDEGVFLIDPADPDTPTVTFDRPDPSGRPQALYTMLWGLPRVDA